MDGEQRFVVRLRRGRLVRVLGDAVSGGYDLPALHSGGFDTVELRRIAGPAPTDADPSAGLVPLGAAPEPGAPGYRWPLSTRDPLWSDKLAGLADRAARAQWDATTDIPWEAARGLKPDIERAVAQVMTYIAQNEYAAYYVPARYLAQVHPSYLELLMWLASHVHDEARHVEVFTKRALVGGYRAHALASTELSLHTLLDEHDFTSAALLLNVLGEGTFLDLLSFVASHAPDAATATAARLAHRDERRHVQFGISHIRRRLRDDPDERTTLVAAVEARAAKLVDLDGLSPIVGESLVLMSAGSLQPADIVRRRHERPRPHPPHAPEPHSPSPRRRLRRTDRSVPLRSAHPESDVIGRQRALFQPSSPSAQGTAVPRLKISSFASSPGNTPILSLSG